MEGYRGIVSSLHLSTYGRGPRPAIHYQQYRARCGNKPCISVHSSYFLVLRSSANGRIAASGMTVFSLHGPDVCSFVMSGGFNRDTPRASGALFGVGTVMHGVANQGVALLHHPIGGAPKVANILVLAKL